MTRTSPTASARRGSRPARKRGFERSDAIEGRLFAEQIEARERHRARQRIGRVGVAVEERLGAVVAEERLVDRVGDGGRAQRQVAGGQRLRQADDVRG